MYGWIACLCITAFAGPVTCAGEDASVPALTTVNFESGSVGPTYLPEFKAGMLLLRHRDIGANDPQFSAYSRDGKPMAGVRIDVPGAYQTLVGPVTPTPDGYAAACISLGGGQRVASLCLLDRNGKLVNAVKTSPIGLLYPSSASDGTIWGFGGVGPEDRIESDDPVLFHYSKTGELLGTALPRRLFGSETPTDPDSGHGNPALASAAGRVVVYAPHNYQLFEVGPDCRVLASYTAAPPARSNDGQASDKLMAVSAVVMTNEGAIYARLTGGERTGVYEFDRANKAWAELPGDLPPQLRTFSLIGADGNRLVLTPAGSRLNPLSITFAALKSRFALPR